MTTAIRMRRIIRRGCLRRLWSDERASQIVEVAVSLPLLVVFVVGIFDFSSALALKQKLTNAAREGARVAAADPANDVTPTTSVPVSVSDAFQVVDYYLKSENVNDCGLSGAIPRHSTELQWSSTAGTGCPGFGLNLKIDRGCATTQTVGQNTEYVVATCVTLTYAYQWQFDRVIGLIVRGATYPGVTNLTTTATAFNEN